MLFAVVFVFILISVIDIKIYLKKKYYKEIILYSILILGGFILSILLVLGVRIPSPSIAIKYIVKDMLHLNYK